MDKYRILLAGGNKSAIDDLFLTGSNNFEFLTTSLRNEDIKSHIRLFAPDVFLYCLGNENRESMSQMVSLKQKLKDEFSIGIFGDAEAIEDYERIAVNTSELALVKPMTASSIEASLAKFIDEKRSAAAEYAAILEAEKKANERKRILVIDDDILMLRSIKEQLKDHFEVATALKGALAYKFLETKKVDLILLDYEMPEENGPQVLEKLRANPEYAKIPVLFLTGVTEREKIATALSLKPQGYLLKPIDHAKLIETLGGFFPEILK